MEVLLGAEEGARDFASAETVARHLDQAGSEAYPAPTAFYPDPRNSDAVGSVAEASRPLSMGAETLAGDGQRQAIGRQGQAVHSVELLRERADHLAVGGVAPANLVIDDDQVAAVVPGS